MSGGIGGLRNADSSEFPQISQSHISQSDSEESLIGKDSNKTEKNAFLSNASKFINSTFKSIKNKIENKIEVDTKKHGNEQAKTLKKEFEKVEAQYILAHEEIEALNEKIKLLEQNKNPDEDHKTELKNAKEELTKAEWKTTRLAFSKEWKNLKLWAAEHKVVVAVAKVFAGIALIAAGAASGPAGAVLIPAGIGMAAWGGYDLYIKNRQNKVDKEEFKKQINEEKQKELKQKNIQEFQEKASEIEPSFNDLTIEENNELPDVKEIKIDPDNGEMTFHDKPNESPDLDISERNIKEEGS